MKQYMGLDLTSLDVTSLSSLIEAKKIFNNDERQLVVESLCQPELVIKHLHNYLKLVLIPTRSNNQLLALSLKNLPDSSKLELSKQVVDDQIVAHVKDVVSHYNYSGFNLIKLTNLIDEQYAQFKPLTEAFYEPTYDRLYSNLLETNNIIIQLHYKKTWKKSVESIHNTVCRKNLSRAFEGIREIMDCYRTILHEIEPHLKAACIIRQIICYIDVLEFLSKNQEYIELWRFCGIVQRALQYSIKEFLDLPELDVKHGLGMMLFSNFYTWLHPPKRQLRVSPEEMLPLKSKFSL